MSEKWPQNPLQSRKFQLGGKERVTLLEEAPYHCWVHRYSIQYMGSGVNGTRRCTFDTLGHCMACAHYDEAPTIMKDGRRVKDARCGRRQQQFGINLLVYKTDLEGRLVDDRDRLILLKDSGPAYEDDSPAVPVYEVFLWRFSADKFAAIREIKEQWDSLTKFDLQFVLAPGKPENFQDFSPTVLPKAAWRELAKSNKEAGQALVGYYKENKYDVEAIMGRNYTDDETNRFLFGEGASSSNGPQKSYTDVASEIEAELATIGTAEPTEPKQPGPVVPAASQSEAKPSLETADFDALLNS